MLLRPKFSLQSWNLLARALPNSHRVAMRGIMFVALLVVFRMRLLSAILLPERRRCGGHCRQRVEEATLYSGGGVCESVVSGWSRVWVASEVDRVTVWMMVPEPEVS